MRPHSFNLTLVERLYLPFNQNIICVNFCRCFGTFHRMRNQRAIRPSQKQHVSCGQLKELQWNYGHTSWHFDSCSSYKSNFFHQWKWSCSGHCLHATKAKPLIFGLRFSLGGWSQDLSWSSVVGPQPWIMFHSQWHGSSEHVHLPHHSFLFPERISLNCVFSLLWPLWLLTVWHLILVSPQFCGTMGQLSVGKPSNVPLGSQ